MCESDSGELYQFGVTNAAVMSVAGKCIGGAATYADVRFFSDWIDETMMVHYEYDWLLNPAILCGFLHISCDDRLLWRMFFLQKYK